MHRADVRIVELGSLIDTNSGIDEIAILVFSIEDLLARLLAEFGSSYLGVGSEYYL